MDEQLQIIPPDSVHFNSNYGVCGTVPFARLSVRDSADYYLAVMESGHYGYGTEIRDREVLYRTAKSEVDSLTFINGQQTYSFTGNTDLPYKFSTAVVLHHKDGRYFSDDPEQVYDELKLSNGLVRAKKGGLVAYLNLSPVFYRSIGQYHYYLARVQRVDGSYGYLDLRGREYCAHE